MRYAIVESGGKQYRAVEGKTIEVDRLSVEQGAQIDIERILLMADGDDFMVGTPTVSGIQVKATVVEHFRGNKVLHFKYSPKKRIRVRSGHRQQYTRLLVDFIGKPGESRKVEKAEPEPEVKQEKPKTESKAAAKEPAKKESAKKAPAKKASSKKPTTTKKSSSKKAAGKSAASSTKKSNE